jgi:hypothetical protein
LVLLANSKDKKGRKRRKGGEGKEKSKTEGEMMHRMWRN